MQCRVLGRGAGAAAAARRLATRGFGLVLWALGAGKSHGELGVWKEAAGSYIGGNTTGDECREAAGMGEGRLQDGEAVGRGGGTRKDGE